ncbi:hypothetical protein Q8O96_30935 [Pseudomonas sp. LPH60]|uniref:hypothetical protein n=1 Tax=Pseudomonas sp. LPH60 TaxID=3065906 RepID=UPI00273B37CA|nr:hypothetical protein [Pseudomonas sp. LPH60]MDP4573489.1 hypothetical protein [Pseudomonas sp. LPH60]
MEGMTLEQLRTTFKSGGLSAARIVAQGKKFYITVDTKSGDLVVLVLHAGRKPRLFGKAVTALKALYDIGFKIVTVEMLNWSPDQGELTARG